MSDKVSGIHGMFPPEGIHTFRLGLYKTLLNTVYNLIGPKNQKKSDKELIDKLHLATVVGMKRQSELDIPHPVVRNGVMDGTGIGVNKRRGNVLVLMIAMKTSGGRKLFEKHCKRNKVSMMKIIKTTVLLLACNKWCHSNVPRSEVDLSDPASTQLKRMILKNFP